jgi:hypothetical protein
MNTFLCRLGNDHECPISDLATNAGGWRVCQDCWKKYQKAYREDNKERLSMHNKEYREANKEEISQQRKNYRANNKEKLAEQRKKCWQKHGKKYSATHYK